MSELSHADSRAFMEALSRVQPEHGDSGRTEGVVTKVEAGGTVWVRVRNSSTETPCIRTVASAKPGDRVRVEIGGGKGTVVGNLSSPPTDDSKAQEAITVGSSASQIASMARRMAENAIGDAQVAKDSATSAAKDAASASASAASAASSASSAASSAQSAAGDAASASASASSAASSAQSAAGDAASAMSSALSALTQLGTVEDVMGTLSWLRDHEVYMPATEFSEGGTYFELVDGKYVEVANPVAGDVANYYVYDHQATMAGFVQEHLTLTERGLYITLSKAERTVDGGIASDSGYILLSPNGGVETFAADGSLVSRHGDEVVMRSGDFTISLGDGRLAFIDDGVAVSWVSDKTMHIDRAEVASSMSIGNWAFEKRPDGNLSLMWREV